MFLFFLLGNLCFFYSIAFIIFVLPALDRKDFYAYTLQEKILTAFIMLIGSVSVLYFWSSIWSRIGKILKERLKIELP